MFFDREKPICSYGYIIPYKYMDINLIDKMTNHNMFRTSVSFLALLLIFLITTATITNVDSNKNIIALILCILAMVIFMIILWVSFYGLLRLYCYISENACPSYCSSCFYKCCINPKFDTDPNAQEIEIV